MLKYIDKPYEEMTIEELKAEWSMQAFVRYILERKSHLLKWKYNRMAMAKEHKDSTPKELRDNADAYISGAITDEEFEKRRSAIRKKAEKSEKNFKKWSERIRFLDMHVMEYTAHIQELKDMIDQRKADKEFSDLQRKRALGYNPREPRSATNYPKDDKRRGRIGRKPKEDAEETE